MNGTISLEAINNCHRPRESLISHCKPGILKLWTSINALNTESSFTEGRIPVHKFPSLNSRMTYWLKTKKLDLNSYKLQFPYQTIRDIIAHLGRRKWINVAH